jgi:hypothetical protein
MLVKVAIAFAAGAAVLAGHWWVRRYDALGRARRFPYFSVGALVVLAVVCAIPSVLRDREEHRLDQTADQLVGAPVKVHCQTLSQSFFQLNGDLGFVKWGPGGVPEHQTYLERDVCAELRDYLHSSKAAPSPDQVIAVHVLTHESMHMRGITSESQAECAAVQRDTQTAELLGATPTEAASLSRSYWLTDYPRMPASYRTTECAPGGALDEHLPTPSWAPAS